MGKIKNGEAKMKPQSYYLVIGSLGMVTVILLSSISAYFISIASLWLRIEIAQGPAYGAKSNLSNLLSLFPWWTLIIGLLSLAFMIFIVKKIGSFYKIRLAYLVSLLVILMILIGYLLSFSSLPGMFGSQRHNISYTSGIARCQLSDMRYYRNE